MYPCTVEVVTAVWLRTLQPLEGEFCATVVAFSAWLVGVSRLGRGVVVEFVTVVAVLGFVQGNTACSSLHCSWGIVHDSCIQ